MSSRRPTILTGILLALLFGYLYREHFSAQPAEPPPLAGKNSVSGLEVKQRADGVWIADFDYFYTGEPRPAQLKIELVPPPPGPIDPLEFRPTDTYLWMAERGAHHVSSRISYPGSEISTREVTSTLRNPRAGYAMIASQRIEKVINWPDALTFGRTQQMAHSSPKQNLGRAITLIDSGSEAELNEAKAILEGLIGQNPQFDAGYVELARIAMKSNWSEEGLHQAESLLASALQIRPDSADAKILLGYVYSHQKRFAKAEALFADAAASNPRNLWLWENWGELLVMEGKPDQAIAKYREAIAHQMPHGTNDRARAEAYTHLLALLEQRKDLDAMEALYKQRVAEFGPGACYSADYARFLLQVRGDTQGAIDMARGALNLNCADSGARQILGLAEYVKWAEASGTDRAEALNQARIYLPAGAMPLYLLAMSDRTIRAAKQLIAAGEQLDQKDNNKLTALAFALKNRDLAAAKRLLALGARSDIPVGYGDVPVALMPVMEGDLQAIRIMQQYGVDYSKLRYRGATAFDFAKQSGNSALLKALGDKGAVL